VHRRGAATYTRAASRFPAGLFAFMPRSRVNPPLIFFLFLMAEIARIVVAPGQTEATIRVQKSTQHLIIGRISTLAIAAVGLALGLPETFTAEITHPVRERAEFFDRIPHAIPAIWAQYGRGPICEFAQAAGLSNAAFGTVAVAGADASQQVFVETIVFINDLGPVELVTDDQFNLTIKGLLPGATYIISAPEMPILPLYANLYYKYEQALILENDRDRTIFTKGIDGLILPNVGEDTITRVKLNFQVDENTTREEEFSMAELRSSQESANPSFSAIYYSGTAATADSKFAPSRKADYLLLDTKSMVSVTVYKALGKLITFTTIKVADRNA